MVGSWQGPRITYERVITRASEPGSAKGRARNPNRRDPLLVGRDLAPNSRDLAPNSRDLALSGRVLALNSQVLA